VNEVKEIGPQGVKYKQTSANGIKLLEIFLGYEKLLILDNKKTSQPAQRISIFDSNELSKESFQTST
jgi:hypothetical protein